LAFACIALPGNLLAADVLPARLCDRLPPADPQVEEWVAQVAPEFSHTRVRELPEKTAIDLFERAAAAGWGGIDLFTSRLFRQPCLFHLPSSALRQVDSRFDFDLVTVIRGKDKNDRSFEMSGMLGGFGKVLVFYDRDGIVYRNPKHDRDFMLSSRVEFDSPSSGTIDNVDGVCAEVSPLGCLEVRSMIKHASGVTVRAGMFTSQSPLHPIRVKMPGSASGG